MVLRGFILVCGSASVSSSLCVERVKKDYLKEDEVEYIEERCKDLYGAKHSYLIATTYSGYKIRYDYSIESPIPSVHYYYWELWPSELFRKSKAVPGLTVKHINKIVKKHALKSEYDLLLHNCQHVSRDSFNEITGEHRVQLRNDALRSLTDALSDTEKERFKQQNIEYSLVKQAIDQTATYPYPVDKILPVIHEFNSKYRERSFEMTNEEIEEIKDKLVEDIRQILANRYI